MSKRYYIVPIVETQGEFGPEFAPDVPGGFGYSAEIPTGPDGRPTVDRVLVIVSADDHTALLERSEIEALPERPARIRDGDMNVADLRSRVR